MAYKYAYDSDEKAFAPPKLQTDRSMWKLMLLSLLTLGIYSVFFFVPLSFDLDKIAPKRDHSKTMNYVFAFILSYFTGSIMMLVWLHEITDRIEDALERRHVNYAFEMTDFWGWYVFGGLILVGPFIYFHKLCRAMNLLAEDYNINPVLPEE